MLRAAGDLQPIRRFIRMAQSPAMRGSQRVPLTVLARDG